MREATELLQLLAPGWAKLSEKHFDLGVARGADIESGATDTSKHWANPLNVQLPRAPSFRLRCVYGIGLPAERAYAYTERKEILGAGHCSQVPIRIDTLNHNDDGDLKCGVRVSEGDGFANDTLINRFVGPTLRQAISKRSYTMREATELLQLLAPGWAKLSEKHFDLGVARGADIESGATDTSKHWANPLNVQLPRAPSFRLRCVYGIGLPAERAYAYTERKEILGAGHCSQVPIRIDTLNHNDDGDLKCGVRVSEGDGTVPLVSLGFMCGHAWRTPRYNPSNVNVVTRELVHSSSSLFNFTSAHYRAIMNEFGRGGPGTGDHVSILGNTQLLTEVLVEVSNSQHLFESHDEDHIHSNILEISKRINLPN